jgi:hypothetical protein
VGETVGETVGEYDGETDGREQGYENKGAVFYSILFYSYRTCCLHQFRPHHCINVPLQLPYCACSASSGGGVTILLDGSGAFLEDGCRCVVRRRKCRCGGGGV